LQEELRVSDGRWISKAQALVKRAFYGAMKGELGAVKALDVPADKLGLLTPCETADGRKFGYLVVPEKLLREVSGQNRLFPVIAPSIVHGAIMPIWLRAATKVIVFQ
jgi:hypothetical protein